MFTLLYLYPLLSQMSMKKLAARNKVYLYQESLNYQGKHCWMKLCGLYLVWVCGSLAFSFVFSSKFCESLK